MNRSTKYLYSPLAAAMAALLLTACVTAPAVPEGAAAVRANLTQLQSDPELAGRAPAAIHAAEMAMVDAEQPRKDQVAAQHLLALADQKIVTAHALAQAQLAEEQRVQLDAERQSERLAMEAERARLAAIATRREQALARSVNAELQRKIDEQNAKKR